MREIRYLSIADELRRSIRAGERAGGEILPSESTLAAEHGVSRVTVRRALEALRDDGLVASRQGYGWFVAADPVPQRLAEVGTIERQLAQAGVVSERRVLSFRFVPTPPRASVLGVDEVLEVVRCQLADGRPFGLVTVWCPADLAVDVSRGDVEAHPFHELLDRPPASATQTIGASIADAETARTLHVPEGAPLLVCERLSRDEAGRPVLASWHRFPAHRTEFVVELQGRPIAAPAGLRLVAPRETS